MGGDAIADLWKVSQCHPEPCDLLPLLFDSHPHPHPLKLYSPSGWCMIWPHLTYLFNPNMFSILYNCDRAYQRLYLLNSSVFKYLFVCVSVCVSGCGGGRQGGWEGSMMMFQQEIKWGWTASVSSSLLQYQLQQPNHDVIMSANRKRHFSSSALWLIAGDNHLNWTHYKIKAHFFFFFFYFLVHKCWFPSTGTIMCVFTVYLCVCVCL